MAKRQYVVVCERSGGERTLEAVGRSLAAHGFEVEASIAEFDTLIGSIDEALAADMGKVEGVASITEEQVVRIPDPDGDGPF